MTAIWAGLRLVTGALPWQAWAAFALALGVAAYGCQQRRDGHDAARSEITRANEKARERADEATRGVENCRGAWDRARGLCLPDRAGR